MPSAFKSTFVCAVAIAAAGCAAQTSFVTTWRAPNVAPARLAGQKVVAVLVSKDEGLRRGIEELLAANLTKHGVTGIPANSIIPTAEVTDEAKVKAKLESIGAASAVVMRAVGRDQNYVDSPAAFYGGPSYSSFYGGYWGVGWGGVYDPGYVRTETVLHIETLVYSLRENKLVWAGQSKTVNASDADRVIRDLVNQVAATMKKQGLLE